MEAKAAQIWIAHDIASALAYCHAQTPQPLLHHDIKSANVLLYSHNEAGVPRLTAKVADFGLAVGVSSATNLAVTARTATQFIYLFFVSYAL